MHAADHLVLDIFAWMHFHTMIFFVQVLVGCSDDSVCGDDDGVAMMLMIDGTQLY